MSLKLDKENGVIGGVCAGLANETGIDVFWIRVAFCVAFFGFGTGLGVYILMWILLALSNGS